MQLEGEIGQYRLALKNKKSVLSRNTTSTILLIVNVRLKISLFLILGEVVHVGIYHSIHVSSRSKFCPSIVWVLRIQFRAWQQTPLSTVPSH